MDDLDYGILMSPGPPRAFVRHFDLPTGTATDLQVGDTLSVELQGDARTYTITGIEPGGEIGQVTIHCELAGGE